MVLSVTTMVSDSTSRFSVGAVVTTQSSGRTEVVSPAGTVGGTVFTF